MNKKTCFGSGLRSAITCYSCEDEPECNYIKAGISLEVFKEKETRISKDQYYLGIALAVSKRSTCLRRHYGAVIVKDDRIVATGYNGSPRGMDNCCDCGKCQRSEEQRYAGYDKCPAVHAEQNAMLSSSHEQLDSATLYLACEEYVEIVAVEWVDDWYEDLNPMPCNMCSKMILNSGISRVVNRKGEVLWD